MARRRHLFVPTCALLASALLTACTAASGQTPSDNGTALSGDVTVFAAASLTDAFAELAQAFEADHPATTVTVNAAGSQQLATQIIEGAPADVFASADTRQMDRVVDAGLVAGDTAVVAHNRLVIAVEPGNPADVGGLADLAREDVTVVLAADEVPAGRYAERVLDAAGVTVTPASLEANVRAVLTRIALGEADAGVVYASDIAAADGRVDGVDVGDVGDDVTATYPVAVLRAAARPAAARAFVALVRSPKGRTVLERAGLDTPADATGDARDAARATPHPSESAGR